MRIKTIKIYRFDELEEEIQEKVLDNEREVNVDHKWWDMDFDNIMGWSQEDMDKAEPHTLPNFEGDIEAFNLDRESYLHFKDLIVYDDENFYRWLEIPEKYWAYVNYNFDNSSRFLGQSNTRLEIEIDYTDWLEDNPGPENSPKLTRDEQEKYPFVYLDDQYQLKQWKLIDQIQDRAVEIFSEKVHAAWIYLRNEYEHLLSDEAVKETLEINEYEFTEDGEIIQ